MSLKKESSSNQTLKGTHFTQDVRKAKLAKLQAHTDSLPQGEKKKKSLLAFIDGLDVAEHWNMGGCHSACNPNRRKFHAVDEELDDRDIDSFLAQIVAILKH